MFTESAELYDAIYFTFKDYVAEARDIARIVRSEHAGARSVLDVACGTGEHARLLAHEHGFEVDGIDLNAEFVRLARSKHAAGHFDVADMTNFALGRQYDAVICMFSSIGYVCTLPAMQRTLECFRKHLAPGGVIIVEPWFPPEKMHGGHQSTRDADVNGLHVHRVGTTAVEGRLCHLRFDYTMTKNGEVKHVSEMHELGLFTEAETLATFEAAGLVARHDAASPSNRGLYVAH